MATFKMKKTQFKDEKTQLLTFVWMTLFQFLLAKHEWPSNNSLLVTFHYVAFEYL